MNPRVSPFLWDSNNNMREPVVPVRGPNSRCLPGPIRSDITEAVQLHVEKHPVGVKQV